MIISFFEEFATKENLSKINLINFKSKIYLAAKDVKTFSSLREKILKQNKKIQDVVWWPVLEKKEGYWISPWSKREAILRIIKEINSKKFLDYWLRFSGISFSAKYNHHIIKMVYSSLYGTIDKKYLYKVVNHNKKIYKDKFILSLGIIAGGLGDEGLISPKELRKCLDIAKISDLKEVVLFRLGGLNRRYLDIIYDFCD